MGGRHCSIVRLLIAAEHPLTQVAIAEAVGVSQPRASQVVCSLAAASAVTVSARGYRGRRARPIDLYAVRSRPHLVEPETVRFSLRPMVEQRPSGRASRRGAGATSAVSAGLGPDLLVPWRHPTLTAGYSSQRLQLVAIAAIVGALRSVGVDDDYRLISSVAVLLHVQRLGLDLPLRATGGADIGVPRSCAKPPRGSLASGGCTPACGARLE